MSKGTTTIEKGIINPTSLKRKLWGMRFKFILPSIIFTIIYLPLMVMGVFDWEYEWILFIVILVVPIFSEIISDVRPNCIYKFNMEDGNVNLFLINVFGMKRSLSISQNEVCEIEYSDKGNWKRQGNVWIHFEKHVDEYYLISDELGEELANNINVDKKKNE